MCLQLLGSSGNKQYRSCERAQAGPAKGLQQPWLNGREKIPGTCTSPPRRRLLTPWLVSVGAVCFRDECPLAASNLCRMLCRSFLFRPHGEAQGPSVQALALAATKSGANSADLQQLASLGNYGRSSEHIASQMISKYCKSDSINLPEPYFVDTPVRVRTADDWVVTVKPVALYLPHEWFACLQLEEQAAGFEQLEGFWENHPMADPKLDCHPIW